MAKKPISTRVDADLDADVRKHAAELEMRLTDYVAQALMAHIGRFNALQQLTAAEKQLSEMQDECDRLDRENTSLTTQRDEARQQRDTFKAKSEENASALAVCEEKIELLLDRGLCDRIVNALPWVETKESSEG